MKATACCARKDVMAINSESSLRNCESCEKVFEVSPVERSLLERISPSFKGGKFNIPEPCFCPRHRQQQRLAYRNERCLYRRKCSATGKEIVAIYDEQSPYPVYEQSRWWSDAYDPLKYGRPFDFSRTFFEQFHELNLSVPKASIQNAKSENCAYTNYSAENKNCYLLVGGLGAEDTYYSYRVFNSRDIVDCFDLLNCELCYDCLRSSNLYRSISSRNCHNGSELVLCENCIGCHNCFGCVNLRNQRWALFNEPCAESEYHQWVDEFKRSPQGSLERFAALKKESPVPVQYLRNTEDSDGDHLINCQRCLDCFTLKNSQDCGYTSFGDSNRDCYDCDFFDNCELQYFTANNEKNQNLIYSSLVWYTNDSAYLMNCFNSANLFGCSGMKKHSYCVLNTQYSKSEYDSLVVRIIKHMQETAEWGQFFPLKYSPFAYNESVAFEYCPLSEQEVVEAGLRWKSHEIEKDDEEVEETPERIEEMGYEIIKRKFRCEESGMLYRFIPQELRFYRKLGLALPRLAPDVRHRRRMERARYHAEANRPST
jgi:hypothetical protein